MTGVAPAGGPTAEQRRAARVAGLAYLLTLATANFAESYARGSLIVPNDAAKTAENIVASERLFRLGTVSDLITFAACVVLLWALYVVLEPVDRHVALLAAFWRLGECAIFAGIMVNDFAALRLVSGAGYLKGFETQQLQVLARVFIGLQSSGYLVGLVFFGLGSTVFAWLWLKSRYIPRILAGWGVFASLVTVAGTLALMVFPSLGSVLLPACFLPIFIFEVTLGAWLTLKGIRAPAPSV